MTPYGRAILFPDEADLAAVAARALGEGGRLSEAEYDRAEAAAVARMRLRARDPYAEALGVGVMEVGVTDLWSVRRGNLGRFVGEGSVAKWQRWSPHLDVLLEIEREPLSEGEREAREVWCAKMGVLWLWPDGGRVLDPAAVRGRAAEWREERGA